jgi:hypothetical protein
MRDNIYLHENIVYTASRVRGNIYLHENIVYTTSRVRGNYILMYRDSGKKKVLQFRNQYTPFTKSNINVHGYSSRFFSSVSSEAISFRATINIVMEMSFQVS